jgi:uncharacterized protein with ParB-like and HNH nuclease domain
MKYNIMADEPKIIKVRDLLTNDRLQIPSYQRPYKWTTKNVNQLIDDVLMHKEKSEYRLGTLVVHNHDNISDIVDGQQRTITLTLIANAIVQKSNKSTEEQKALSNFNPKLLNLSFANDISKANIQNNYKQIERRIADFDEKAIWFFLEKCTLVEVVLSNISEAFQFFDSQNARGKDLEPHDLLKAFHLREMNNFSTEEERKKAVEKWENMDTAKLSKLFSQYLFRIRNWSKGYSARYFSKNEVDVFKGVSPDIEENYPFAAMLRIAHFYVEEYNRSYHRNIDKREMPFPFQIDETIINGKRFFEMIEHYQIMVEDIENLIQTEYKNYWDVIISNNKHLYSLFCCTCTYYCDRFGNNNLKKVIHRIFVWIYSVALDNKGPQIATIDNLALGKYNAIGNKNRFEGTFIKHIKEGLSWSQVLDFEIYPIKDIRNNIEPIIELFKELKYYESNN